MRKNRHKYRIQKVFVEAIKTSKAQTKMLQFKN